jgi:glyoxylase-like metal-dependent hydrolase (beta-lactamase superfamily II)
MDVIRLHLAQINVIAEPWPVHGFVVLHPALGPALVDSGCGAPQELLDGDTELGEGLRLLATPGHTVGQQSVAVDQAGGEHDLLIGDVAFTTEIYHHPEMEELPDGQETDRAAWAASLERIRRMQPSRVHFCHDTGLVVS